jgi:hypothetical protein
MAVGIIGLAVLVAGCAGSNASTAVRSFDEILDGALEIVELSATSAAVRVETTVDAVCSVVYGIDTSYGSQTTDPDMRGLAHDQHYAPMRGLQPDTLYHYRLQGTASDGTVYISDDFSFRTLAAEAETNADAGAEAGVLGINVASVSQGARVIDVSSEFGGGAVWGGGNVLDEDPRTEWSSAGDGDASFVLVELRAEFDLTAVGFWTRTMSNSARTTKFQVVTGDGTILGPFDVPDAKEMYIFPVRVRTDQLRFEVVESSGGNTGAVSAAGSMSHDAGRCKR